MKRMMAFLCFVGLFLATMLFAGTPAHNVNASKHPNLARAQGLINKACDRITMAQKANEFDMGGHAAKAKTLLEDADREIKLAALEANENKGKLHKDDEDLLRVKPAKDINKARHPNLASAQEFANRAYMRVSEAQKANEFDMEGHAAKAKTLLEDANKELKAAAIEANQKGTK